MLVVEGQGLELPGFRVRRIAGGLRVRGGGGVRCRVGVLGLKVRECVSSLGRCCCIRGLDR